MRKRVLGLLTALVLCLGLLPGTAGALEDPKQVIVGDKKLMASDTPIYASTDEGGAVTVLSSDDGEPEQWNIMLQWGPDGNGGSFPILTLDGARITGVSTTSGGAGISCDGSLGIILTGGDSIVTAVPTGEGTKNSLEAMHTEGDLKIYSASDVTLTATGADAQTGTRDDFSNTYGIVSGSSIEISGSAIVRTFGGKLPISGSKSSFGMHANSEIILWGDAQVITEGGPASISIGIHCRKFVAHGRANVTATAPAEANTSKGISAGYVCVLDDTRVTAQSMGGVQTSCGLEVSYTSDSSKGVDVNANAQLRLIAGESPKSYGLQVKSDSTVNFYGGYFLVKGSNQSGCDWAFYELGNWSSNYIWRTDENGSYSAETLDLNYWSGIYPYIEIKTGYPVTLHPNDGEIAEGKDVACYAPGEETPLPTAADMTREGYLFDGWYVSADLSGDPVTAISGTGTGAKTFYAKWVESHTVTFVSDGVETGTQAVADGRTAVKPADPAKSGYLFGGWFKEETCENEWDFETDTITEDLTLYAKWTPAPPPPPPPPPAPKTYTVRFLDGDAELSSLTVQAGDKAAPPDEPEKEGFRFAGWHTDREGTAPFDFETAVTADLTLYAKWSPVPTPDPEPTPPPAPSQPSGGSSSSRDDDDDEPRPPAATTTTTTRDPDGTTTSVTTDRTTGKVTTVTKTPEGVSVTVTQDKNGDVTSVRAEVPARKDGTVHLPVEAEPGAQVDVRVQGGGTAAVELPVRGVAPGTVAVTVSPDGAGTVIRKTLLTGDGVAVTVRGSASVRLEDRGRTFADVPAGGWKAEAAAFVSARELFNGTGPDTFNPDGPMTRAMLAAVLHNLEGNPAPEGSGGFLDVSPDAWCADAVSWAAIQRIVDGYAGGLFRPGAPITREQLAVMLWRYAGCPAPSPEAVLNFPDADAAGDYAREALLWAVEKGVLSGYGDGRLDPKGTATRVQAAQMLRNFMTR